MVIFFAKLVANKVSLVCQTAAEVEDRLQEIAPSIAEASTLCAVLGAFTLKMELKVISKGVEHTILYDERDHEFVSSHTWSVSAHHNTFYASTNIKRRRVLMHRLLLGLKDSKKLGEHADRNGLNNTRENIRVANRSQNQWNRGVGKNSTSGMKGVGWSEKSKKWSAEITVFGKKVHLGFYGSKIAAGLAYNKSAKEFFGEFALLNYIGDHSLSEEDMQRSPYLGKSGYRGVFEVRGRFRVRVFYNKKRYVVGEFNDIIEAAKAYDIKAKELHGDSANLNFK